ncbi:hypothetical protein SND67_13685 [Escherichia coli]|nr:hypothetical protein [Escherichia coli]
MIEWIIRRSVANRFLVLMGALFLSIWGTWTIINTPVDALPDLSDVQVIITRFLRFTSLASTSNGKYRNGVTMAVS